MQSRNKEECLVLSLYPPGFLALLTLLHTTLAEIVSSVLAPFPGPPHLPEAVSEMEVSCPACSVENVPLVQAIPLSPPSTAHHLTVL